MPNVRANSLAHMDHNNFLGYLEQVRDDLLDTNPESAAADDYTECIYRLKLYKESLSHGQK